VVLEQNEPDQLRPEMATQSWRQRRRDDLTVGGQPAFSAIADHPRLEPKVLDDEVLVAFETRSDRRRDRKPLLLVDHQLLAARPRTFLLATPPRPLLRRLLHARRLQLGLALVPLQPRDLLLQRFDLSVLVGELRQQLFDQAAQRVKRQIINRRGGGLFHTQLRITSYSLCESGGFCEVGRRMLMTMARARTTSLKPD
jgi:hypothetical protein